MSQRNSGYIRKEGDLYETPAWVTETLLGFHFHPPWLDFGARSWVRSDGGVLKDQFRVLASDISEGVDFPKLKCLPDASVRGIALTRPMSRPWSSARRR